MIMHKICLLLLVALGVNAHAKPLDKDQNQQQLNKFAISQCLMQSFPNSELAADAGRASGAYVEFSEGEIEVYEKISAAVAEQLQHPYQSKSGGSLHVMQCLEMPEQAELQSIIGTVDPTRP